MAGDWIKIEHSLPDKPEVVRMADLLGIDQDAVVGKLIRLWIWADQQTVNGNALNVTESFIDRITFTPGFSAALSKVDWLEVRSGSLSIPRFERHNGQTAKSRANTNRRVAEHRARSNASTVTDVTSQPLQKPLPEKRREEILLIATDGTSSDPSRPKQSTPTISDRIKWNPDNGFTGIADQDLEEWEDAYPAVNVTMQINQAHMWLKTNPAKRKKNYARFLTGWLSRAQERGGDIPAGLPAQQPKKAADFRL